MKANPSLSVVLLTMACVAGCTELDGAETSTDEQAVTSSVPAMVAATTTFTGAVATSVRDTAAARGLTVATASVRTGLSPRTTIGAAPSGETQLILVGKSISRGTTTMSAGLYQLVKTSQGVMLYRFDPTGPTPLGIIAPTPEIHNAVVDDVCGGAPSLLRSFCEEFTWCALFDEGCPALPGVTWVG